MANNIDYVKQSKNNLNYFISYLYSINEREYTNINNQFVNTYINEIFSNDFDKNNIDYIIKTNIFGEALVETEKDKIPYEYSYSYSYINCYFEFNNIENGSFEFNDDGYFINDLDNSYININNKYVYTKLSLLNNEFTSAYSVKYPDNIIESPNRQPQTYTYIVPYDISLQENYQKYNLKNNRNEENKYLHSYLYAYDFSYIFSYEFSTYTLNSDKFNEYIPKIRYYNNSYYMIDLSDNSNEPKIKIYPYSNRFDINNCDYVYYSESLNTIKKVSNGTIKLKFNIVDTDDTDDNINNINSYITNKIESLNNDITNKMEEWNNEFNEIFNKIKTDYYNILKDSRKHPIEIIGDEMKYDDETTKLDNVLFTFNEYKKE